MGEVIFKIVIMETSTRSSQKYICKEKSSILNYQQKNKRNKNNYLEKTDYKSSVIVMQIFREGQKKRVTNY